MQLLVAMLVLWVVVPPSPAVAGTPPVVVHGDEELEEPEPAPWDDDENPFTIALKAPMALPWFWNACLDGWAPWGRGNAVKNTCSFLTIWLGATMIVAFPFAFAFSMLMTAMAALVAVFALYTFITTVCATAVSPNPRRCGVERWHATASSTCGRGPCAVRTSCARRGSGSS